MKVIQINEYCGTGSTGKICFELANLLHFKGNSCWVIYGRKKATKESERYGIRMTGEVGVRIHGIATRIFDRHAFSSTFETLKLLLFINSFKPDIIHLHNLHGYYINVAVLFHYIKRHNLPIVWTLHDCWTLTGHCAHFFQIGCERWISGCYQCPQKREYPASFFWDMSKFNWKKKKRIFTDIENIRIVTPSFWLSDLVSKSYLNRYQINVIPNGVDLDIFYPRKKNIFRDRFKDKKIILGVSYIWNENKGIKDFIDLSFFLDKTKFQIVLVGSIEDKMVVPPDIFLLNRTDSPDELAQIYSSADIYLNLSKVEVFGMTVVEAMACGCPVLSYECGGTSEIIEGTCGSIVSNWNLNVVIEEIKKIVEYDQVETRKACLKQAKKFSKEKMLKNYYLLYEEMLKNE